MRLEMRAMQGARGWGWGKREEVKVTPREVRSAGPVSAGAHEPRFDYIVKGGKWASMDVELSGVGFDGEKTDVSTSTRRCYDKPRTTLLF